jgi:hypothetical protein
MDMSGQLHALPTVPCPQYPFSGSLGGSESRSGRFADGTVILHLPEVVHRVVPTALKGGQIYVQNKFFILAEDK